MQQIKLMSKLGLALIAITAISVALAIQASYYIQTTDAQAQPRLPNNSVTSQTIVDGEVKSVDIGDGEVKLQDLASGAIQLNVQNVEGDGVVIAPGARGDDFARCPAGYTLTGGGFAAASVINVTTSHAQFGGPGNTWEVSGLNESDIHHSILIAHATCIRLGP